MVYPVPPLPRSERGCRQSERTSDDGIGSKDDEAPAAVCR